LEGLGEKGQIGVSLERKGSFEHTHLVEELGVLVEARGVEGSD
jgi:hypothetical protein